MGDYQRLSTDSEAVPPSPYPPLPSSPSSPPLRLQSSSPFQQHKRLIYASLAAVLVLVGLSQVPGAPSATTYFKNDEIPAVDYRGVEQIPPVVSVVEEPLRSFEWKEEPDETLLKQLASLSPSERRVRDWLYSTRKESSRGTGIGIRATVPPQPIRPAKAFPGHRFAPGPDEGPGLYEGGSFEKYAALEEEWRKGYQVYPIEQEKWMENYTRLHNEILSGKREPKFLEYTCPEWAACGGLADRMLGMITTFVYAVLTDRAVFIGWEQPLPLEMVFDSPYIDWSNRFLPSPAPSRHEIYDNKTRIDNRHPFDGHTAMAPHLMVLMTQMLQEEKVMNNPLVQLTALNTGRVIGLFNHPLAAPLLAAKGMTVHNIYAQLMRYLFRPTPSTLDFIHHYSSFFALPSIFSVGIHIRTGDASMKSAAGDAGNTIDRYRFFFDCADAAAETYAKPGQRTVYFLVTDSANLRNEAVSVFGDKLVISGLHQQHGEEFVQDEEVPPGELHMKKINYTYGGEINTIAETWAYAETDFALLTDQSGYGKFPSFMRGKANAQIALVRTGDPKDCRLESSLARFTDLAESWSMG